MHLIGCFSFRLSFRKQPRAGVGGKGERGLPSAAAAAAAGVSGAKARDRGSSLGSPGLRGVGCGTAVTGAFPPSSFYLTGLAGVRPGFGGSCSASFEIPDAVLSPATASAADVAALPAKFIQTTSFKPKTLNPVWKERFRL